jgi:hypothetical protein
MITAIDTNILLDVYLPDETHLEKTLNLLEKANLEGALIISGVVYAELVPRFPDINALDNILQRTNIRVSPIDKEIAALAGRMFKRYRNQGGARERILADFLIGAHATLHADRFLTRDRGFYRKYFDNLVIME